MLIQYDVQPEKCQLRGPLSTKKKLSTEQLLQNNYKNGSRPKEFNKNTDTSNTAPTQDTIALHQPRVNSVRFGDPYDHTKPMENTHEDTHLIDTQEQDI